MFKSLLWSCSKSLCLIPSSDPFIYLACTKSYVMLRYESKALLRVCFWQGQNICVAHLSQHIVFSVVCEAATGSKL